MAISNDASHSLYLSSEKVLQHDDALLFGCALVEASPITAAPELLGDNVRLLPVPCEKRDTIQEGVSVALTNVVVHGQTVREAYCLVVGIASCAGVT